MMNAARYKQHCFMQVISDPHMPEQVGIAFALAIMLFHLKSQAESAFS